ncbi:diguanylate cyclase (GGDEF)-like protein/PAS domain S-box-containing protein [Hamadaea flava]|uniref:Bifunctional diguanylate cyclase/phosphodiesterase n=1 Tax=Hamadaea flava TaxID=1742688 RepID=A0ABV8LZK0_9ACTN|nr:bifunctional diguanylate cyclase/phosphodiesterase [Hamadaea flava]MCP2323508.1 diguanylate cyclase (GGDEF)-like protein/PAS domain S-box-containing protein [Hamadaea flava]
MSTSRLIILYVAAMIVLTVAYVLWPAGSSLLVAGVAAIAVGAVAVGVERHRPQRRAAWILVGASLATTAAARVTYDALPGQPGTLKSGIWSVWLLHLATLLALGCAVLGLVRTGTRRTSVIIDAVTITLGAGLLLGVLVALPYAGQPGIGVLWKVVRVAYVARDVAIFTLAAVLAMTARATASRVLLEIGLVAVVVYDVLFRLGRIRGEWLSGTPLDVIWLLFFAAVGAAALVPSMTHFDHPAAVAMSLAEQPTRRRLGLVLAAALMPSMVLVITIFGVPRWYESLLAAAATAVLLLIFARLLDVTSQLRAQIRGERVVGEAVSEFAYAHDTADIASVVDRAVRRLVKPGRPYRVALVPADEQSPIPPALEPSGRNATWSFALTDAATGQPDHAGPRRSTAEPLTTPDGVDNANVMVVEADPRTLADLGLRLEALAIQAGLALQRIGLDRQIARHTRETYFRTLVQKSTDIILIIDDDDGIRYATPSAFSLLGQRSLDGESVLNMVEPLSRAAAAELLARARRGAAQQPSASGPYSLERVDWTLSSADGAIAHVEVSCRDLRSDPSIGGLVLTLRNVTEQRRLEHELAQRALHDPLTGLGNRLLFTGQLDAVLAKPDRADAVAAVLFVDLDDMKLINDGFGHEVGDTVLTAVARRLTDFLVERNGPAQDTAARLGGDEFAVLLTGIADPRSLELAASALTVELAQPIDVAGAEIPCGASVGVATTVDARTARDLLRNADLALYAAKGTGKSQWRRYEPWMRRSLMDRLALRTSLEHAVDNHEYFLEYQPIVELQSRTTVGFEALLRWQHPTRGRLSPHAFIGVAEETGLITRIGDWVLTTSLDAARRWGEQTAGRAPYVAINVSARQFRNETFAGSFRRLLAESGLPSDRVVLEITESLLLGEDDRIRSDLQRLRSAGVRIAIDDFGTGYSALSYLRHVPLDIVKLDRAFITAMTKSGKQRELVAGIVTLARILNLQVIAEGIETQSQAEAARQAGCDFGQGFLFSRPLPDPEAVRWAVGEVVPGADG